MAPITSSQRQRAARCFVSLDDIAPFLRINKNRPFLLNFSRAFCKLIISEREKSSVSLRQLLGRAILGIQAEIVAAPLVNVFEEGNRVQRATGIFRG
jgi:hypothetical protein